MIVPILLLIVSLIPAVLIFFYLRGIRKDDQMYRHTANRLLGAGLLCCLGVALLALILNIAWGLTGLGKTYPLLNAFFHDFILAAFVEEFVKYHAANRGVRRYQGILAKMDIVAFFGIVAIGFDIIESAVYLLESSPMQIIVRGICIPHVAYGFIMGWFVAKAMETGKRSYIIPGFLIPFLLHGCYDFFLSEEIEAVNEYLGAISLLLVVVDLIVVIRFLFWIRKEKKKENQPINE